MEIQAEKLKLIQWLAGLTDAATLSQLLEIKRAKEDEWWFEIDAREKADIEKGLAEADSGDVVSHKEAMQKYEKWL